MKVIKSIYLVGALAIFAFQPDSAIAKKRFFDPSMCNDPSFYCYKVKRGDSWKKLFPDTKNRDMVMRLNRTNLSVRHLKTIIVPYSIDSVDLMNLTPFAKRVDTGGEKLILIDLHKHAFAAYNDHGYQVHWGPISGGKGWCPDVGRVCRTIVGSFKIYRKQGEGCVSSKFPLPNGGAKMPYCMHFKGGYAMHGSQLPGHHASHGCVRLFKSDAKWLNHHFAGIGTKVVIVR